MLGNTENQTWGCCVRSKYATSLLCSPSPSVSKFLYLGFHLFLKLRKLIHVVNIFLQKSPPVFLFSIVFLKSQKVTQNLFFAPLHPFKIKFCAKLFLRLRSVCTSGKLAFMCSLCTPFHNLKKNI